MEYSKKTYIAVTPDVISVTFVDDSKPETITFVKENDGAKYYRALDLITAERVDELRDLTTSYAQELQRVDPEVTIKGNQLFYKGSVIHNFVTEHIIRRLEQGLDVTGWVNFLKSSLRNPHNLTVNDLYRFLDAHEDCPITHDGAFLAYKKVDNDYQSFHSGVNGKEDWTPGTGIPVKMRREDCDGDRNNTCSRGLHFCSRGYLSSFYGDRGRVVQVKIFPEDVVAIPNDYNNTKGRCCRAWSLKEIPELRSFAFRGAYTAEGELIDESVEEMKSELAPVAFARLESAIELFFKFGPGSDESTQQYTLEDLTEQLDSFLEDEEISLFVFDESDVLHVLENTEKEDLYNKIHLEAIEEILVTYAD